ncbi:MAG: hypothetical protein WCD21_44225, partial [Streptomyces sp.]
MPPTPPVPPSAPAASGATPPGPTPPGPSPSAPPPQAASPAPATYIGPYRVIRELGAGGMGRVHLAASRSGRAVAVKVV